MSDMLDPVMMCIYCGDVMEAPSEKQIEIFGRPTCCEFDMLVVEREKIHTIVRSLDNLRKNLETELLKGVMEL